jgi:hypothetical protein
MSMVQSSPTEIVGLDGEVMDLRGQPTALEAITRAEIDTQIATAKRFPRSADRFIKKAINMVSVDPDLAAKCTYAVPRRDKDGKEKILNGPSVRLAEIVACCWGNLKIAGRIVDDDGKTLTGQGVGIDLEENVSYALEAKRSVVTRAGRRFSDDMVVVTGNALIAIITRNVTFKVVPRAFVSIIHERAMAVARGDERTLFDRLNAAIEWFAKKGVKEADIYRALDVPGKADVTLDHLVTLNGFRTSVSEGIATVAEIFAPPEPEKPTAPVGGTRTQQVAGQLGTMFGDESKPETTPAKPEKPAKKTREPGEDG